MRVHQSRCPQNQEILLVHDKKEYGKTIEELSEASTVSFERIFNSHDNCSADWCFKTRAPEEGNAYNDKDDGFRCKKNDNQLHNLLRKTIFLFQKEKVLKESLHMFDTQKTNQ